MSARDVVRPISVEYGGERLFGMLHVPAVRRADVAVVCLSSGMQNRAGPHRIYVKAARRFAQIGLASLRLDLIGVGDSTGRVTEMHFDQHDPGVIPGVVDVLERECGITRVVLLGLCAGARIAMKGALRDRRVDGVALWGMPIVSGPVSMPGGSSYISQREAKRQLREWLPKLVDPRAWYRYLRKPGALADGSRMMVRALGGLLPAAIRRTASPQQEFFGALDAYLAAARPILLLYGEDDMLGRTELLERFPAIARGEMPGCTYGIVSQGDHTFTQMAATDEVIARTVEWLAARYLALAADSASEAR
jgi:pimeloyl-ACP methyl ester carboxylesterase